jgi:hypothetical protein
MSIDEKQLVERLKNVRNRYVPSKLFEAIDHYEIDHRGSFLKKYPGFVSHIEASFELLNRLIIGVNYIEKTDWPSHRGIQLMIVADNLRFFYTSFQMLFRGFANESMILGRVLYEAFVAVLFVSCYPNDSNSVITAGKGQRQFQVTNFVRDDLALDDWVLYHLYSTFAHFNKHDVATRLVDWAEGKRGRIEMQLAYDQTRVEGAINCLHFLTYVYLRLVLTLFVTSTNDTLTEGLVNDAKEMGALYEMPMADYPKPFWPKMAADASYIFKILEGAEAGKDWKELVKDRRERNKSSSS